MQFIAAIENDTVDFTRYYGDTLKVWWAISKKNSNFFKNFCKPKLFSSFQLLLAADHKI